MSTQQSIALASPAHEDEVFAINSPYKSETLTEERRAEITKLCGEATRTSFYDTEPELISEVNEWTAENFRFSVARLTLNYAIYRLGLEVCQPIKEPILDEHGDPLIGEDGEIETSTKMPEYEFALDVVVEGATDSKGVAIPKGKVYFRRGTQATNRPPNKTNWEGLVERLLKFCLNGETFIKDANWTGISEQHRCIARIILSLCATGPGKKRAPIDPSWGPFVFAIDGIHPIAAITADTGKSNTGKDIFASDPELLPVHLLQTKQSLSGTLTDDETGEQLVQYIPDQSGERVKALGKCESAVKMVLLRLQGKNVNASLGNSNESTELAHRAVSTFLPDLDDLAAYCHVFECPRINKKLPVTPNDLCTAIALHALSEYEPVSLPLTVESMAEYSPMRIDVQRYLPFLQALSAAEGHEPTELTKWLQYRASGSNKATSKADKFAQLCRVVEAFYDDTEEVSEALCNKPQWFVSNGYYHFGGADIGKQAPAKKGKKVVEVSDDE